MTYTVDAGYIDFPIDVDPTTLQKNAMSVIASELPSWVPRESHIEVLLLEQFAAMCAESAQVSAQVPQGIFSYFGTLIGITPEQGSSATAQTTWTMIDNKGYTVPAGTIVSYNVNGTPYYFTVVDAFTVPTGSTQTEPGAVLIEAQGTGVSYNGLAPQNLTLVTSWAYVSSVAATTTSSGGADPETTDAYLDRLSDELQLLSPRPILPADFAALAQSIAGVYRAAAFNGLNPFANMLETEDSTFDGGNGSWVESTNCSLSNITGAHGESAMKLTSSASGNMAAITGAYDAAGGQPYQAILIFDEASVANTVAVVAKTFDINGTLLSTHTGGSVEDSTSLLTFASLNFTSDADTDTIKLLANVVSASGSSETHTVGWACLANLPESANFIPDSSALSVSAAQTWALTNMDANIYATDVYSFDYTGTGSAASTSKALSQVFTLGTGDYVFSCTIDGTNVTSGAPEVELINVSTSTTIATLSGTVGQLTTPTTGITLDSDADVTVECTVNGATVQDGLLLHFVRPQLIAGSTAPTSYSVGPTWTAPGLQTNNERTITVAAVDSSGNALSDQINANIATYLESQREINFIVNVIGPTYTGIDVTWSGTSQAGYDPGTVQAAANTALASYLSPANWAGGNATPPYWDSSQTTVNHLSVITILGETPGLTLTSVTLGYHGGDQSETTNVELLGNAPLPYVGEDSQGAGYIVGTVVSG